MIAGTVGRRLPIITDLNTPNVEPRIMLNTLNRSLLLIWFCIATANSQLTWGAEAQWNRFRGPNGSGISSEKGFPSTWTTSNYRWTVELPGEGVSSPVIWDDKLFVTAANDAKLTRSLLCYSTQNGKLLWSRIVSFTKEKKHRQNTYATNTPAVDAERVYAFWQSREGSQLVAYDHAGNERWSYDVGPYKSGHGGGISPAVIDGVVALNLNHEGDSRMLGVDAATGKLRWSTPREVIRASYSTPCEFAVNGQKMIIFTSWKHGFTAVDPQTGKILWERDEAFDRTDSEDKRSIGSPFVAGNLVYGNCGFVGGKKFMVAMRPTGKPGTDAVEQVFRVERNVNHMPCGLVVNGLLFMWTDAGIVHCADALTGQTLWQNRASGNFSSSPISVDGKIYCVSDDGEVHVIAAAREFKELGKVSLGEGTSATPAVANGTIYFRTKSKLFALGSTVKK